MMSLSFSVLASPACVRTDSEEPHTALCETSADCVVGLVCDPVAGWCVEPAQVDSKLSISPTMQDFGPLLLGETGLATTFTITNSGGNSTELEVSLSGSAATDFAIVTDNCAGEVLETDGACTIDVSFTPSATSLRGATLDVTTGNAATNATARLTGTGLEGLGIAPSDHGFGDVTVGSRSETLELIVRNGRGGDVAVVAVELSGEPLEFEIVDACSGAVLSPTDTCTIEVTFTPATEGQKSGNVRVFGPAEDRYAEASFTGVALGVPRFSITPISHDFGTLILGAPVEAMFEVSNTGGAATSPLRADLEGPGGDDFSITSNACDGEALAPALTCAVVVEAYPSMAGPTMASLTISGAPGESVSAALSAAGFGSEGLEISPPVHDFGVVPASTSSPARLSTVTNIGGMPLTSAGVTLTGMSPGDFSFVAGSNGCDGVTLAPNSSCSVEVEFAPSSLETRAAVLLATAGGLTATAALAGTGVASATAQLSVAPSTQSFGSVSVGSSSAPTALTVRNIGGTPSGVPTNVITGASPSSFAVVTNFCNMNLPILGTCTIELEFVPTSVGGKNAVLEVAASPGGTVTVNLDGIGLSSPSGLTATPSAVAFGAVVNGGSSTSSVITIENAGGATGSMTVSTTSPEFVITNDLCAGAVPGAGGSCEVHVAFAPSVVGLKSESLTAVPQSGGTLFVPISGESVDEFAIAPTTDPFDFGDVTLGGSATETFTVTNTAGVGSKTRTISATVASTQFAVTGTTCATQSPGTTCTVDVQFAPTGSAGVRTDALTVTANGVTRSRQIRGNAL